MLTILKAEFPAAIPRTLSFQKSQGIEAERQGRSIREHSPQRQHRQRGRQSETYDRIRAQATLVGKSWDFHVHTALQTTLEENLSMIYDSIAYLKQSGMEVIFDAEHFLTDSNIILSMHEPS